MTPKPPGNRSTGEQAFGSSAGFPSSHFPRPSVPDHELIKQIGRGSYGEVWLARNATGSYRAVKVVYRATFEEDKPYEREFSGIREFEPISRFHPAQIDILHVGRNDQARYFYYVMELADDASADGEDVGPDPKQAVAGRRLARSPGSTAGSSDARVIDPDTYIPETLRSVLRARGRLPINECVRVALSLAEALEHLHGQGLVHRDLKPSNVIFANGCAKLADIGLVARADAALSIVGTEGYLPPEGPGKPQADIYSLGKVCYEMATGKDRNDFPEPPLGIEEAEDHRLFLEFNEVVTRCCEHAGRRYETADELAADLRMLLAGRSVRWKNAWSRNLWVAVRSVAALAILASAVFLGGKAFRQVPPRSAVFAQQSTTVPFNFQDFELADLGVHLQRPRRFDISPDGRRILFADPDGKLFLYENESVRPLFESQAQDWIFGRLAWKRDGEAFAVSGYSRGALTPDKHINEIDHTLLIGDLGQERLSAIPVSIAGNSFKALLWRPDGSGFTVRLTRRGHFPSETVTIALDGTVQPWSNPAIASLINPASTYSPNGKWLCGGDRTNIWLIHSDGTDAVQVTSHPNVETHPTWADDETLFFVRYESPSPTQKARLMRLEIDSRTGAPTGDPDPLPLFRLSQILHPRFVNGGEELMFFDRQSVNWIEVCSYPEESHIRQIGRGDSPAFLPDGSQVAYINRSPGEEGIYIRPSQAGGEAKCLARVEGIPDGGFDISPDGSRLVYLRPDGPDRILVELTGLREHQPTRIRSSSGGGDLVAIGFGPCWSPRGDRFCVATGLREIALVDPNSGRAVERIELNGDLHSGVPGPRWSPSGDFLACVVVANKRYCIDVLLLADNTWKRVAEDRYIEQFSWRPGSTRGEMTYFTYEYPNCHRTVFLDSDKVEFLLPVRPSVHEAQGGEHDFWGAWDPLGRDFYFSSESHPTGHMHVFHADTGEVDHDAVPDWIPFWSRDGSSMGWVNPVITLDLRVIEMR